MRGSSRPITFLAAVAAMGRRCVQGTDWPRVGVQDALRAMIRATVSGTGEAAIGQLRAERRRRPDTTR